MLYLDNAATTSVRNEALEAMWPYLTGAFGNPSSPHEVGRLASAGLEDARTRVARIIGGRPTQVTFTSGGSEANNLAIKGACLANPRGRHLITTPIEHDSVLETAAYLERFHDFEITYYPRSHWADLPGGSPQSSQAGHHIDQHWLCQQ